MSNNYAISVQDTIVKNGIITKSTIDMDYKKITSLDDPDDDYDAANKRYVDFYANAATSGSAPLPVSEIIVLNNNSFSTITNGGTTGSYLISVVSLTSVNGPCGIFIISKLRSNMRPGWSLVGQTPGLSTQESLEISWPSNGHIQIRKTGVNYDGSYKVVINNTSL